MTQKCSHVFESLGLLDLVMIVGLVIFRRQVWIIEPFQAFHRKGAFAYYPSKMRKIIKWLITTERVRLVHAEALRPADMFFNAPKRALDEVNMAYARYREDHMHLIRRACSILDSEKVENAFKWLLGQGLVSFYSTHWLITELLLIEKESKIVLSPIINTRLYNRMSHYSTVHSCTVSKLNSISFSLISQIKSFVHDVIQTSSQILRIFFKILRTAFRPATTSPHCSREFSYGVAVHLEAQVTRTHLGADMLVDNVHITGDDVAYFPLIKLNKSLTDKLYRLPGTVIPLPDQASPPVSDLVRILGAALRDGTLCWNELEISRTVIYTAYIWKKILETVRLTNFISYCDFAPAHIGRNIMLCKNNVTTWYYSDSMNACFNFRGTTPDTYIPETLLIGLYYDHFVCWCQIQADLTETSGYDTRYCHVVGCLKSISPADLTLKPELVSEDFRIHLQNGGFVLAAFDSTYSVKGATNLEEGIAFAQHILRLADDIPELFVIFKEKKTHAQLKAMCDSEDTSTLLECYEKLANHPRVESTQMVDTPVIINLSDFTVSFPFTAPTFEALAINRPAGWHDPLNRYPGSLHAQIPNAMSNSYDALKALVETHRRNRGKPFAHPYPAHSPFMDPYRDGKALDRFRQLLLNHAKQ